MSFLSSITLSIALFFALHAQGQSVPSATATAIDTTAIASQTHDLVQLLDQQVQDSMRRALLEDQLVSVRINDQKEKQQLLAEINILKSRDSVLLEKRKQKVDALRSLNQGVGVRPFQDSLFTIYTELGSYSKNDRAMAIEERIRKLSENYAFHPDSLQLGKNENGWIIYWHDHMLVSINEQDALWADIKVDQLAANYLAKIKNAIAQQREDTSMKTILTGLAFAGLIILLVVIIIVGIGKLVRGIKRKILASKGKILDGIKIKGYELISASKQIRFLWTLLAIFKWMLILITVYLALPSLLNLFPSTKGYAPILLGYFLKPVKDICLAIVHYLPNLITILVISFIFHYLVKGLKFFADELHDQRLTIAGFYPEWAYPTYQILRVLFLAFMVIVIFPYFPGSDTPIFKGISVFIGVLFTFSSAGALGNIIAGLLLTYMRSFTIGDRIKIGDVTGDIIEKTLLVTRIRTIKNEVISIPNSQVMNSHTINYSVAMESSGLIVYTNITMSYEIPWQKIHELAIKAANRVDLLEKTPSPFVLQTSLDDFYVTYQVNAYTKQPHQQDFIYSELHKQILDVFHEAGIEILSPHYKAVRDGSTKDMPPENRGANNFTPAFQVKVRDDRNKTD